MPIPSSTLINFLAPEALEKTPLNSRHQDQARAAARDTWCLGPRSPLAFVLSHGLLAGIDFTSSWGDSFELMHFLVQNSCRVLRSQYSSTTTHACQAMLARVAQKTKTKVTTHPQGFIPVPRFCPGLQPPLISSAKRFDCQSRAGSCALLHAVAQRL
eukprot:1162064-Pelagomonas_calceolata.AAC.1